MHTFIEIFHKTLFISGFVLMLMILIEYIHTRTLGQWNRGILKNRFFQIIFATLLGLTPGCAGAFAVVSLYTHQFISFSALLSATIASFGDEAFVIFATSPETGIYLIVYLSIISIVFSLLFLYLKINKKSIPNHQMLIHDENCCKSTVSITHQLRKITFQRALLLGVMALLLLNTLLFSHHEEGHSHFPAESIVFILMLVFNMFVVITVPEHFLIEHIWNHVLKNHFVKLFLWALVTILLVHIIDDYISLQVFVNQNIWLMLLFAIIVGLLPLSGPHLIFFTLFLEQAIPFSILLANSIVQEGHAGIPLIAEDKKSFFLIKSIKILIALLVGAIMIIFNV